MLSFNKSYVLLSEAQAFLGDLAPRGFHFIYLMFPFQVSESYFFHDWTPNFMWEFCQDE